MRDGKEELTRGGGGGGGACLILLAYGIRLIRRVIPHSSVLIKLNQDLDGS